MSFDGAGEPELGTGARTNGSELDAGCRRRFAVQADRLQREPAKDWRRGTGSHGSVMNPLDALRHQRRGAFFANGLDIADDGSLYVANFYPGITGGIYRVRPGSSVLDPYHRCFGCSPNGLRVKGTYLYYSGIQIWPYLAAVLRQVDLAVGSAKPDASRLLVVRPAAVFDDFDILDDGFVAAEFANFRHLPLG